MYRMKGNRDATGQTAPAAVLVAPIFPTIIAPAGPRPRRRLLSAVGAGLGAGLIVIGSAGLVVAETRDSGNVPPPTPTPVATALSATDPPPVR